MTDRDVLERASEALRKTGEPSDEELARLRARVLGSNNVKASGRKTVSRNVRWLLPIAAAFMAASALAATPGAWEGLLDAAERFLDVEFLAPEQRAQRASRGKRKPETAPTPVGNDAPQLSPETASARGLEEPANEITASIDAPRASSRAVAGATEPTKPKRVSAREGLPKHSATEVPEDQKMKTREARPPSADLVLYRNAHEKHFRDHDYAAALMAWESYLAQLPAGTFSVEAKYNRALCLVRLGRYAEARSALSEFADGKVGGGYRRDEAARFIEALDNRP